MRTARFKTAREMLQALRSRAAGQAWRRAKCASRCAKAAPNRRSAAVGYAVKNQALSRAVELAPELVRLGDGSLVHRGILGLGFEGGGWLRVPARALTPPAQVVLLAGIRLADWPAEAGAPSEGRDGAGADGH